MHYSDGNHRNFKILIHILTACNDGCLTWLEFVHICRFWHCICEFKLQLQIDPKYTESNIFECPVLNVLKLRMNRYLLIQFPLILRGTFTRYWQIQLHRKMQIVYVWESIYSVLVSSKTQVITFYYFEPVSIQHRAVTSENMC